MRKEHCTAIVLAGGSGRRMGTQTHKQYLLVGGREVLYYSLKAFQDSEYIDEIILVAGAGEEQFCRETFVEKYGLSKVTGIVAGGKERYHSVWNGLQKVRNQGYVFVHDGARPFVDEDIIRRGYESVTEHGACVAGMPSKDTIKMVGTDGIVTGTPPREMLWLVQTPQVFCAELLKEAYRRLMEEGDSSVTDDAMVVERYMNRPVAMYQGSYKNIKITTPEDLEVAEVFLKK